MYVHNPGCHECMGSCSKDHLALVTAFVRTVGWSLKGEVKAKIKISPVVVFGVLSRMVLVRGS